MFPVLVNLLHFNVCDTVVVAIVNSLPVYTKKFAFDIQGKGALKPIVIKWFNDVLM